MVNDTDIFDDHVVNLPFAPLEIKPIIYGKFFPSLVYDFGADIERPISSSKLRYKLHAKFCTIGFCPLLINERLDATETLEKRFYQLGRPALATLAR